MHSAGLAEGEERPLALEGLRERVLHRLEFALLAAAAFDQHGRHLHQLKRRLSLLQRLGQVQNLSGERRRRTELEQPN